MAAELPDDLLERRRIPFRPMILAANEPRFVVDLDSAGGLSGHLLLGLSLDHGPSKWLHQFGDLDVRYVDGRMEYVLRDAAFPGITVRLMLLPLADSVGLVMKIRVEGRFATGRDRVGLRRRFRLYHELRSRRPAVSLFARTVRRQRDPLGKRAVHAAAQQGAPCCEAAVRGRKDAGLGDPKKVLESPAALCASAQWCSAAKAVEEPKRVAVQKIRLGKEPAEGWIVIGRGGKIESFLADPS